VFDYSGYKWYAGPTIDLDTVVGENITKYRVGKQNYRILGEVNDRHWELTVVIEYYEDKELTVVFEYYEAKETYSRI
jgi:hypothetical protein